MCGVIGLTYEHEKMDMGAVATRLLKMLEYRGYDSTGAVVQDSRDRITLLKDVGAPSVITRTLGIDKLQGRMFCGQVRWATFGVVTKENAQPHDVTCKIHIYGAHNGNITNCVPLKKWLVTEGHDVKSDNDGEMLVHTVEHFFALELKYKNLDDHAVREKALKAAVLEAAKKMTGSFAAIIVDPVSHLMVAIKAGSSLYIGQGHDEIGGPFVIASSDLASVLQLTRVLIPIKEKEFAVFTPHRFDLYNLATGARLPHKAQRSLLKVEETKLQPPFRYFMEQDIYSQGKATRRLIGLFTGGNNVVRLLRKGKREHGKAWEEVKNEIRRLTLLTDNTVLRKEFRKYLEQPHIRELREVLAGFDLAEADLALDSSYASFLDELRDMYAAEIGSPNDPTQDRPASARAQSPGTKTRGKGHHGNPAEGVCDTNVIAEVANQSVVKQSGPSKQRKQIASAVPPSPVRHGGNDGKITSAAARKGSGHGDPRSDLSSLSLLLKGIDGMFELDEIENVEERMSEFTRIVAKAQKAGNTVYMLACGTSYHAAKTAPLFFNEIAGLSVVALLPGEFRAQCTNSLRDGDVVIGISQSGETKDLIDVFNFIAAEKPAIKRICVLNNTNSTLALEKSDLFIPLFCGPEIAVPATKSFINQLLVLLILAIRVNEHLLASGSARDRASKKTAAVTEKHLEELRQIPDLIERTLTITQKETDEIARDLFLAPSMHILATRILGIAKEGALKIREVVLNHTEGFEGSEFKHGPNTILGVNTIFGLDSIRAILDKFGNAVGETLKTKDGAKLDGRAVQRLFRSAAEYAFADIEPKYLSENEEKLFNKLFAENNFFDSICANYPLIFVTCPQDLDINLTISQINTHKIRGADVYMIAEDDDRLREAVSTVPGTGPYRHGYITLPRTGSLILPIFSITVVLQVLALKMSIRKMEFLNRLEISTHGVHPDVPKNVSKSITVD